MPSAMLNTDASIADFAELKLSTFIERSGFLNIEPQSLLMTHLSLPAATTTVAPWGVCLCPPLSVEKVCSARSFVQLARHLAASGIACVRYDPAGSDDSTGSTTDIRLNGLVEEALRAGALLRRHTPEVKGVIYIGLLIGATVARLAATRETERTAVIMIEPVVDGRAWWQQMLSQQRMSSLLRGSPTPTAGPSPAGDGEGMIEIRDEFFDPKFEAEVSSIGPDAFADGYSTPQVLVRVGPRLPGMAWSNYEALTSTEQWQDDGPVFWNEQSLYAGYWPASLADRLLQWIRELGV
jgi:hypothetical protein